MEIEIGVTHLQAVLWDTRATSGKKDPPQTPVRSTTL